VKDLFVLQVMHFSDSGVDQWCSQPRNFWGATKFGEDQNVWF